MGPLEKNKNLLIVGASGLIGGCISRSMYGSFNRIIGIARRPFFNPYITDQINEDYCNITPRKLFELNPSHLVFCFSELSQFKQYLDNQNHNDSTLVDFQKFLITLFSNTTIQHIFLISSAGAIYNSNEPVSENSYANPTTLYGYLKKEMELILINSCKKYSINFTIFRLSNVYGNKLNGQISGGFINTAIELALLEKEFEEDANLRYFYRDFVYIDDLNFIFKNLILENSQIKNSIINIATGRSYNLVEVKSLIIDLLRKFDLNLSCKLSNRVYIGPKKTIFDITLLKQLIPSIAFTNLSEGITQSIKLAKNYYLD